MKLPKEYSDNLKNGIITDNMISDVLFSYSKRAKNYRDKNRELRRYYRQNRYAYDKYDTIEKNEFRMNVLYERKSDILHKYEDKFLKCIHKQDKKATRRVYDYDDDYDDVCDSEDVVWANSYLDRDECRIVYFVDVLKEPKEYFYFLYYEFPDRSFHTPIDKTIVQKYIKDKNLEVIELDDLVTFGEDVGILLSLQFCDKVYKFLFPDKEVRNISSPIIVSYDDSTRFATDEEIQKYKDKKQKK